MRTKKQMTDKRLRRRRRIRGKISGDATRPRLSVFRSNKHIYAQLIDDVNGETLISASSLDAGVKELLEKAETVETVVDVDQEKREVELDGKRRAAHAVGKALAQRALEQNIDRCVFDRNGFIYHGRVAAVAAGARDGGLNF